MLYCIVGSSWFNVQLWSTSKGESKHLMLVMCCNVILSDDTHASTAAFQVLLARTITLKFFLKFLTGLGTADWPATCVFES